MILILLGRSGCGKTAIAKRLMEHHGYQQVRTCTTRKRREGEAKNAYHFLSKEDFEKRLAENEFVEFDAYGDSLYGTLKESLKEEGKWICVVTPEGAKEIKKEFPDAFIVNIETDMKTSVLRAILREKELSPQKMDKISHRAIADCAIFANPICDYVVKNPDGANLEDLCWDLVDAHQDWAEGRKKAEAESKIVILQEEDGSIPYIIIVDNYNDSFDTVLDNIIHSWYGQTDEFYGYVIHGLRKCGYRIRKMGEQEYTVLPSYI